MRHLTLEQFQAEWQRIEAVIDATPSIDRWCTGPDWTTSVATGFAPLTDRLLLAAETVDGYATLARYETSRGMNFYGGMEPLWGFGAPVFGPRPGALANELAEHLAGRSDWRALYLPGMPAVVSGTSVAAGVPAPTADTDDVGGVAVPVEPCPFTMELGTGLAELGPTRLVDGIVRRVADLSDGYEAWAARRTGKFRRNLRRAARQADEAGLSIGDAMPSTSRTNTEVGRLFTRLMAIEHRSWKGREGSGITAPEMRDMYSAMITRLAERDRLEVHIARLGGDDVGYILGGVRNDRYRGLQISYVDGLDHLSIGNLLQHHQIRLLTGDLPDGRHRATTYDLGMDFDYKRRWADRIEPSLAIVVNRRPG